MPDGISDDGRPPPAWGPSAGSGTDLGLTGLFADPAHPAGPSPATPPDPAVLAAQHQAEVEAAAVAAAAPRSSGAHRARRQPARYVLPAVGGALALVLIVLGVFGWFGRDNDATVGAPVVSHSSFPNSPTASSPPATKPASPTPKPSATLSSAPTVKPPPVVVPPPAAPPVVHAPSVILNETQIRGLAATVGAYLTHRGWTITGLGNWHGRIGSTTVYYPPGMEAAARSMAYDLGRVRIKPRVQGMLTNRLTVVLTGNPL